MRKFCLIAFVFAALTSTGQPVLPPPSPANQIVVQPALPPPVPTLPPTPSIFGGVNALSTPTNTSNVFVLLTDLQTAVEQALPALANFNDTFDFVVLGSNNIAQLVPDTGTNAIVGLGNALSSFGMLSASSISAGTLVTNATPAGTLSRGQVAALLIIENDLERLLPLLSTVNDVSVSGTNAVRVP
jgi:hypothetical protein